MQELLTDIWEQHRLTVLFVTHDVEEAVYISDRVLVMTNRPGRIKDEIRVPLAAPAQPRDALVARVPGGALARAREHPQRVAGCRHDGPQVTRARTVLGAPLA